MKRQFPPPLHIDCDGLSIKRAVELAEKLVPHFSLIEFWEDEIIAHKPLNMSHYGFAWNIIDQYSVNAS